MSDDSETKRIDMGNTDWFVKVDSDGNVWIRPSLGWEDGEVYESLRNGQDMIYELLRRSDVL